MASQNRQFDTPSFLVSGVQVAEWACSILSLSNFNDFDCCLDRRGIPIKHWWADPRDQVVRVLESAVQMPLSWKRSGTRNPRPGAGLQVRVRGIWWWGQWKDFIGWYSTSSTWLSNNWWVAINKYPFPQIMKNITYICRPNGMDPNYYKLLFL